MEVRCLQLGSGRHPRTPPWATTQGDRAFSSTLDRLRHAHTAAGMTPEQHDQPRAPLASGPPVPPDDRVQHQERGDDFQDRRRRRAAPRTPRRRPPDRRRRLRPPPAPPGRCSPARGRASARSRRGRRGTASPRPTTTMRPGAVSSRTAPPGSWTANPAHTVLNTYQIATDTGERQVVAPVEKRVRVGERGEQDGERRRVACSATRCLFSRACKCPPRSGRAHAARAYTWKSVFRLVLWSAGPDVGHAPSPTRSRRGDQARLLHREAGGPGG